MIWVANRGISKPLFRPSKSEAVDSDIYINDCLEKPPLSHIDLKFALIPSKIYFSFMNAAAAVLASQPPS